MIKARSIKCAGMGEVRNVYNILVRNQEGDVRVGVCEYGFDNTSRSGRVTVARFFRHSGETMDSIKRFSNYQIFRKDPSSWN